MKISYTEFAMVPTWVVMSESMRGNPTRIATYVGVRVLKFEHPQKEWASERDLADDVAEIVGVGAEAVRKHLRAMRVAGVISGDSGVVGLPADQPIGDTGPQIGDTGPQIGDTGPQAPITNTEDETVCPSDPPQQTFGFDHFWQEWPTKEKKVLARKAYEKALTKAGHQEIMDGLARSIASWQTRDRKFIPLPTSWLNQERWEDELEPAVVVDMTAYEIGRDFLADYAGRCHFSRQWQDEMKAAYVGLATEHGLNPYEIVIRMVTQIHVWMRAVFYPSQLLKNDRVTSFQGEPSYRYHDDFRSVLLAAFEAKRWSNGS